MARRPRRRGRGAIRSGAPQKHSSRISSLRMTHDACLVNSSAEGSPAGLHPTLIIVSLGP
jgi:hypothetical protein